MPSPILPLAIGDVSTASALAADVGKVYIQDGKMYRLVKTANAITTPTCKILTTAITAGVPTWTCDVSTTISDRNKAGVIPASITATIAASSYLLLQVSGAASVIPFDTLITATYTLPSLQVGSVAGQVTTIASGADAQAVVRAYIGYATNSAVITAVGLPITCILAGFV